jgi:hypothetical protein
MPPRSVVLALLAAASCGGTPGPVADGSTTVVATGGTSFGPIDTNFTAVEARAAAESTSVTFPDGLTHYVARVWVILSNVNDGCSVLARGVAPAGMTMVIAGVQVTDTSPVAVAPGTYAIDLVAPERGAVAFAGLESFSAVRCKAHMSETSAAGTVTLSTITADDVSGALDITMPDGTHVTGTFTAPVSCAPQVTRTSPLCM